MAEVLTQMGQKLLDWECFKVLINASNHNEIILDLRYSLQIMPILNIQKKSKVDLRLQHIGFQISLHIE